MTTMLLADHGAQVTKIEPPGGDPFRQLPGHAAWGRGKRSAILDLKTERDRDTLLALVRSADVLVESFRPGVTGRLGIDYATLSALNPRLIYCSITAYGSDNRHAGRPGYDALVAARTGLQWEQRGWPEGALYHIAGMADRFADLESAWDDVQGPARPGPLFSASNWPSLGACFAATTAISAALLAREATGVGQRVETSLLRGALFAGIILYVLFLAYMARASRGHDPVIDEVSEYTQGEKSNVGATLLYVLAGLIGLPVGAHLLVDSGSALAAQLGVRPEFIGLTIVAFGTSLPELATVVAAAVHRKSDVAIGNVIGSNIFNIFAVGGAAGLTGVAQFSRPSLTLDIPFMIGAALLLAAYIFFRRDIGRISGLLFLIAYAGFIAMLALGTG